MQTTYNVNPAPAVAGMVVDSREGTVIISKLASGAVPVGLAVAPATDPLTIPSLTGVATSPANPGQVKAWPASVTTDPVALSTFMGIPIYDSSRPPHDSSNSYSDKDYVPVLRKGVVWVNAEGAVTQFNDVYIRTATSGGFTTLGTFADGAGTGLCKLPNARFLTSVGSGGGLVQVELI